MIKYFLLLINKFIEAKRLLKPFPIKVSPVNQFQEILNAAKTKLNGIYLNTNNLIYFAQSANKLSKKGIKDAIVRIFGMFQISVNTTKKVL